MKSSEHINELATALAAAQSKFPTVSKDANNPFFKSKYADLAALIEAVQPHMGSNGLSISQLASTDIEARCVVITTMLMHKSGQWMSEEFKMPVPDWKAQGLGSGTTYARRYALQSLLNLAAADDDGNAASARTNGETNEFAPQKKSAKAFNDSVAPPAKTSTGVLPQKESASPEVVSAPAYLDAHQIKTLWARIKGIGGTEAQLRKILKDDYGIESTKQITIGMTGEIEQKIREMAAPESHGQPLGEF